jgi:hypothetical protein
MVVGIKVSRYQDQDQELSLTSNSRHADWQFGNSSSLVPFSMNYGKVYFE